VVVFNNDAKESVLSVPLGDLGLREGNVRDALGGPDAMVRNGVLAVELPPRSAAVYIAR
jgi:hypothetical protein